MTEEPFSHREKGSGDELQPVAVGGHLGQDVGGPGCGRARHGSQNLRSASLVMFGLFASVGNGLRFTLTGPLARW
jgi:hypothetical protein